MRLAGRRILITDRGGVGHRARYRVTVRGRYVIKRVGQPSDIAYAALYLSCDESAYVTGTTLAVDAGRTFH